jgi:hypothetical protein
VKMRLHRAHRQIQRRRQFLVTHPLHIVPVDQHLILNRQPFNRLLQPIAQQQIAECAIVGGRLVPRPIVSVIDVID